jgi:hypothetical protein
MNKTKAKIALNSDYSYFYFNKNAVKLLSKSEYLRIGTLDFGKNLVIEPANEPQGAIELKNFWLFSLARDASIFSQLNNIFDLNLSGTYIAQYEEEIDSIIINLEEKL